MNTLLVEVSSSRSRPSILPASTLGHAHLFTCVFHLSQEPTKQTASTVRRYLPVRVPLTQVVVYPTNNKYMHYYRQPKRTFDLGHQVGLPAATPPPSIRDVGIGNWALGIGKRVCRTLRRRAPVRGEGRHSREDVKSSLRLTSVQ